MLGSPFDLVGREEGFQETRSKLTKSKELPSRVGDKGSCSFSGSGLILDQEVTECHVKSWVK